MLMPSGTKLTNEGGPDGEGKRWQWGDEALVSFYALASPGDPHTRDTPLCEIEVGNFRAAIEQKEINGQKWIDAWFKNTPDPRYSLDLKISDVGNPLSCQLASQAIKSVIFVGDWKKLELVRIFPDRKAFQYRVESGEVRLGRVGSDVTSTGGRVVHIGANSVEIVDLETSDSGTRSEIGRTFYLAPKPL